MKKIILCLMILSLLTACAPQEPEMELPLSPTPESELPTEQTDISVMSFNILAYNTGIQQLSPPATRAPVIFDFLLASGADIIGVQEATDKNEDFNWYRALADGVGQTYTARCINEELSFHSGKMKAIGEGLVILYRTDRFALVDSGCQNYFEDTKHWFQWTRLRDTQSGREILVTNTHLSINEGGDAELGAFYRESAADELVSFWEENAVDIPLFATGDYNSKFDTKVHAEILSRSDFISSKDISLAGDTRDTVDFVYVNQSLTTVESYRCLEREYDGTQMSDHFPIQIECKY